MLWRCKKKCKKRKNKMCFRMLVGQLCRGVNEWIWWEKKVTCNSSGKPRVCLCHNFLAIHLHIKFNYKLQDSLAPIAQHFLHKKHSIPPWKEPFFKWWMKKKKIIPHFFCYHLLKVALKGEKKRNGNWWRLQKRM